MKTYLTQAQINWLNSHPELTPKASMLRRCKWHDYCAPCIYMITLVVNGRKPLLGTLHDPDSRHKQAWVQRTDIGNAVKRCWSEIPSYYPQIKLLSLAIMPDHMHGIIHVTAPLPRHLGHVINGFKKSCNDILRFSEAEPRTTGQQVGARGATGLQVGLWERGYHDRILSRKGQLDVLFNYLQDNPRRLWMKRRHREYFTIKNDIEINGEAMSMMGNAQILNAPFKASVQCSRHLTEPEIEQECIRFLSMASQGTVLVSPCISLGEKTIMAMAMQMGYPVIILRDNGFNPMSKPSSRFIDACAEGKALFIAPAVYDPYKNTISRSQCLELNQLAAYIASKSL